MIRIGNNYYNPQVIKSISAIHEDEFPPYFIDGGFKRTCFFIELMNEERIYIIDGVGNEEKIHKGLLVYTKDIEKAHASLLEQLSPQRQTISAA